MIVRRAPRWFAFELAERSPLHGRTGRWVEGGVSLWRPVQEAYRLIDGAWTRQEEDLLAGYVLASPRRAAMFLVREGSACPVGRAPLSASEVRRLEGHESTVVHYSGVRLRAGDPVFVKLEARSSFAGLEGELVGFEHGPGVLHAHLVLDVYGKRRDVWVGVDQVEKLGRKRRWRTRGAGRVQGGGRGG